MIYKLGKKAPAPVPLKFWRYLGPNLPPPPPHCDWTLGVSEPWGMDGNDKVGCCTMAAKEHIIKVVTAAGDGIVSATTDQVLACYSQATGYDPSQTQPDGSNPTDQGDTMAHSSEFMVQYGMVGQKMDAFAEVDKTNQTMMKQSIALLGALDVGIQLPASAMDSFGKGVWSDTSDTNILGGHDVPVFAYDKDEVVLVTWGATQRATWQWLLNYTDESIAPLFLAWAKNTVDTSPDGLDLAALEADLKSL